MPLHDSTVIGVHRLALRAKLTPRADPRLVLLPAAGTTAVGLACALATIRRDGSERVLI